MTIGAFADIEVNDARSEVSIFSKHNFSQTNSKIVGTVSIVFIQDASLPIRNTTCTTGEIVNHNYTKDKFLSSGVLKQDTSKTKNHINESIKLKVPSSISFIQVPFNDLSSNLNFSDTKQNYVEKITLETGEEAKMKRSIDDAPPNLNKVVVDLSEESAFPTNDVTTDVNTGSQAQHPANTYPPPSIDNFRTSIQDAKIKEFISSNTLTTTGPPKQGQLMNNPLQNVSAVKQKDNFVHNCFVCNDRLDSYIECTQHSKLHDIKHQCLICKKKFTHSCNLSRHVLSHFSEMYFPCVFCPSSFKRKDNLKVHITMIHSVGKRQPRKRLNVTKRINSSKRVVSKKIMDKGFRENRPSLQSRKEITKPVEFDVETSFQETRQVCGSETSSQDPFAHVLPSNHSESHSSRHDQTHLKDSHPTANKDIEMTPVISSRFPVVDLEMSDLTNVKIENHLDTCENTSSEYQYLSPHSDENDEQNQTGSIVCFNCTICHMNFDNIESFQHHDAVFHSERYYDAHCDNSSSDLERVEKNEPLQLKPSSSSHEYTNKSSHEYANEGYRLHPANHNSSFSNDSAIDIEQLSDVFRSGYLPTKVLTPNSTKRTQGSCLAPEMKGKKVHIGSACRICLKHLKGWREIVDHQQSHSDITDSQFWCVVCQTHFSSRECLQRHAVCHLGQRFQCPLCDANYSRRDNLKQHIKCAHNKHYNRYGDLSDL